MVLKRLDSTFFMISIFGFVVAGIMFIKLSYIDWPYLIGGILFYISGFLLQLEIKTKLEH